MEKGSFHTSETPTADADEAIKNIPLPNQLPRGVSFSDIPASGLKSSTLESLISQNEDLMARLSVALRKSNQFEEKSAVLERENAQFRAKFETLREQFLILQEKDRIAGTRSQQVMGENAINRDSLQKLEKIYSELYVQAQAFQRRVVHLERYRARIHKAAPGIQEQAKRAPALIEEKKIAEMNHMQSVNSYEAKLSDVRLQIEIMRKKAAERDQIFGEKVQLENDLVHEKRQNQSFREEMLGRTDRLETETGEMRFELKEKLLELDSSKQECALQNQELIELREQNKAFADQVESLQVLWAHKQKELDMFEEKNKGLQKLNQSLSISLNDQRKDMQNLRSELESERFGNLERIKALTAEIQMIRAESHPAID